MTEPAPPDLNSGKYDPGQHNSKLIYPLNVIVKQAAESFKGKLAY